MIFFMAHQVGMGVGQPFVAETVFPARLKRGFIKNVGRMMG